MSDKLDKLCKNCKINDECDGGLFEEKYLNDCLVHIPSDNKPDIDLYDPVLSDDLYEY